MSTFSHDYIPSPDPFVEFDIWIKKAMASGEKEPTAMTLSTVDKNQRPRGRIVLYKGMSEKALTFFTNYESDKGHELEIHPSAALTFYWKSLNLQLRVEGKIAKTSRQESEKYFSSRARESQIGAWVSQQSRVLKSRKDLEAKKIEFETKFEGKDIVCPPFWGGYKVIPDFFEFWIAGDGRLHDRFQFTLDKKTGWSMSRLYP